VGVEADWIVTEPDGVVIHPDTLLRRWTALVEAAGVRLDVVSRQLGHASIATTANIYTHDNDAAGTEAAALVAAELGAAP